MTTASALQRLRAKLNEASAGFFSDADLYNFLDSGQLETITICKSKQDFMQKTDMSWYSVVIQSLIVPDTTVALTAGTAEYALPSDFLYTHSLMIDVDNTAVKYRATLVSFDEFLWREGNTFTRGTSAEPKYYIRSLVSAPKFGVSPTPSSSSGTYLHHYYKVPATVTSGVELALRPESHNAIIEFAYSFGLQQDNRSQESELARQTAINLIKDL